MTDDSGGVGHSSPRAAGASAAARQQPDRLRLLLVDHHTVVRDGLRSLLDLQGDLTVVEAVGTVAEALSLGVGVGVDVVVAELDVPDVPVDTAVSLLADAFGRVLVLTGVSYLPRVLRALAEGAVGYVLKTAETSELVAGIHAVARGETYLQPSLGVGLAKFPSTAAGESLTAGPGGLTATEVQVLHLLALGHTNAEIAARLGTSIRTVESNRARIGAKLGSHTRADLVREAQRYGLGEAGESV